MKLLHMLTNLLIGLAVFAGACFILYTAFQSGAAWETWLDRVKGCRFEVLFIAFAALLLVLLHLLSSLRVPERVQYLAYDIEGGGAVSISLKAIQEFVAKIADEFAAVVSLDPKLKAVNGAIDVQLDVKVKSGSQIPELCRMLQDRVRESIKQQVGISDIREVRVRVQEIVLSKASETIDTDVKPESYT